MKRDPEIELEIQSWVDGELAPEAEQRLSQRLRDDPNLAQLAQNLRAFSQLLRTEAPTPQVPDSRDFYWSRIRRGIEAAGNPAPTPTRAPFTRWLAWLVPAGAVALTITLLLPPPSPTADPIPVTRQALTDHEVETPSSDISSLTFYAAQDGMTIVWLGKIDML